MVLVNDAAPLLRTRITDRLNDPAAFALGIQIINASSLAASLYFRLNVEQTLTATGCAISVFAKPKRAICIRYIGAAAMTAVPQLEEAATVVGNLWNKSAPYIFNRVKNCIKRPNTAALDTGKELPPSP